MPAAKAKTKKLHPTQAKRQGQHHKHSEHYVKVYWPYMPLLLISILGSALLFTGHHKKGVLGYATNLSKQQLLQATNNQRTAHHQSTLLLSDGLSAAAQAKANDMAKRNYWSHNTPEGQAPWMLIQQAGYQYQKAGENLAYGFDDSNQTITGWMNSPTHRANLLDNDFQDVGFGFANVPNYQGSGPETIIVAEYGRPGTSGASQKSSSNFSSQTVLNNKAFAISRLASWSHGRLPAWVGFALGLSGGSALMYLLIKHSLGLHKWVVKGETLILHHPIIDACLLGLIFASVLLGQSVGFIR